MMQKGRTYQVSANLAFSYHQRNARWELCLRVVKVVKLGSSAMWPRIFHANKILYCEMTCEAFCKGEIHSLWAPSSCAWGWIVFYLCIMSAICFIIRICTSMLTSRVTFILFSPSRSKNSMRGPIFLPSFLKLFKLDTILMALLLACWTHLAFLEFHLTTCSFSCHQRSSSCDPLHQ